MCDVDLDAAAAARLREAGRRPRAQRSSPPCRAAARAAGASDAGDGARGPLRPSLSEPIAPMEAEVYAALMLGLRDYVEKNGFGRVVLGLSGGIDSALVACLAVDALGPERVSAAIMPSPYSSPSTQETLARWPPRWGCATHELPIESVMESYVRALSAEFAGRPADLTEENLQARIRGNLLMALSNKFGWLVLTTGNKSEMSVGYTTLYGDLAGGFAVIKDVPKTLVYRLCEWRNSSACADAGTRRRPARRLRSPLRSSSALPRRSSGTISATRTRCHPTSCSTASCRATSSSIRAASS